MSSSQAYTDNGEGSSAAASSAADAAADAAAADAAAAITAPPVPAPATTTTPASAPTGLEYLKGIARLPTLIKTILRLDEELARQSKVLCDLPIQRELSFREFKNAKAKNKFNPANNMDISTNKPHYNVTALLVYVTGDELAGDEACCLDEGGPGCCLKGIFPLSVVPAEANYDKLPSKKACANCQYDGMGSKCPLQKAEKAAGKRKAEQLDGQAEEDDDKEEDDEEEEDEEENNGLEDLVDPAILGELSNSLFVS